MTHAESLLARLDVIDALERALLAEARALVREAERWAEDEGDERARAAVAHFRAVLGEEGAAG